MSIGRIALVALLALALAIGWSVWAHRPVPGVGDLEHQMENQGRILVLGAPDLLRLHPEGSTFVTEPELSELSATLDGTDDRLFARMLTSEGIAAVLVDGRQPPAIAEGETPTVRQRLAHYAGFEALACEHLAPTAALYTPRTNLVIDPPLDEALAHVARAVLRGTPSPRVSSFPEPLRRIRNVEVMVMLEDRGHPRLWRSARGSSIGRALLTAAVVARQRWSERQSAMGGPIDRVLPTLDVSVYLLDEDGTLGARSAPFIETAFTDLPGMPEHGVAFDHRGTWRYLLPDATREQGEGSAVRAYRSLFADSDMDEDSFERDDVRLYRMLARRLAISRAGEEPMELPDLPPGALDEDAHDLFP
ncbi:MAG: hypothetical protein U0234_06545 [Sandaracinus sp.]